MGRSFDRGGQNRKERERGKRRNFRQAERDREARDAVLQVKRTSAMTAFANVERKRPTTMVQPSSAPVMTAKIPAAIIEQKRPGFFAQVIGRFFKKSA
jgi:hypothetical protein